MKPAFLEGWKCTTLRAGSSGSAFCRNYQSNKGKTIQKLTGTMTPFIIFSYALQFCTIYTHHYIYMLNYVNCKSFFFFFLIPKSSFKNQLLFHNGNTHSPIGSLMKTRFYNVKIRAIYDIPARRYFSKSESTLVSRYLT